MEPSTKHYYQPLWTLVGAGVFPKEQSKREESAFIPSGADWIREHVAEFHPAENYIVTRQGRKIGYDFLVVGLGIQIDWSKIPGLQEGIGRQQICSNYSYQQVDYTWECVRNFKGGTALFTMPKLPSSAAVRRKKSCTSPRIIFGGQAYVTNRRSPVMRHICAACCAA